MNDKLRYALETIKDGLTWGQDSDVLIGIAEKALAASKPEPLSESCVSVAMSPCQFSGICKYCKPEPQAQAEPIKGYELTRSDEVCLNWYRLGFRDAEAAHGIKEQA